MLKPEYYQINTFAADILASCVTRSSATLALSTRNNWVIVHHGEGYQLPQPSHWETIENANIFLFPKITSGWYEAKPRLRDHIKCHLLHPLQILLMASSSIMSTHTRYISLCHDKFGALLVRVYIYIYIYIYMGLKTKGYTNPVWLSLTYERKYMMRSKRKLKCDSQLIW